jgi:parallel beta-helix repeat protein
MYLQTLRSPSGASKPHGRLTAAFGVVVAIVAMASSATNDASGQPASLPGGVTNVRDFRAAGDGATDDTAAIKQALSAALRSRGTLYFPPGTYLISETLTVTDTVAFVGSGWGSVLMLRDGARRIMILVQGSSPSGETVGFQASNLVLDGNRGGQLDAGLLQINSSVGFVVDHLWVRNGGRVGESRSQGVAGIAVAVKSLASTVPSRGVIMNSLIEATTKPGVVWSTHATDGLISGNIIRGLRGNSLTPCLAVSEGRNVSVTNNSVSECEGAGISIANGGNNVAPLHALIANNRVYANGTGSVEGNGIQVVNAFPDRNAFVKITGNVVYENGGAADGYGIMVQNVDHAVVDGNIVRHNKRSGIVLYNVHGALLDGNYVYGNNTLRTPEHSGLMLHQVSHAYVTSNFVFDTGVTPTQAYGLFFSGTRASDRVSVTNNVLYPNKRGAWHGHVPPTKTVFIANRTTDDTHFAVETTSPGSFFEITTNASSPAPGISAEPAPSVRPAGYLHVKRGGKAYRIPLYDE